MEKNDNVSFSVIKKGTHYVEVTRRGSMFIRRRSSLTALLANPPPGLKWMSFEVWKCLKWLVAWTLYCIIGAGIFIFLEVQEKDVEVPHHHWNKFRQILTKREGMEQLLDLKDNLMKMCDHTFLNQSFSFELSDVDGLPVWRDWDKDPKENRTEIGYEQESLFADLKDVETACRESLFVVKRITSYATAPSLIDAMYYTMTAITTIGYGHICPTTTANKIFCVLYCLIGVPLTCIFLNNASEYLSIKMLNTYKKAVCYRCQFPGLRDIVAGPHECTHSSPITNEEDRKRHSDKRVALLYIITAFFLGMGFIVFMFIPSIALMFIEDWTYLDSFYYTFITLSTIGFGDYIAGYEGKYGTGWGTVYKLILILWIILSLVYWMLVLKFVTKALKKTTRKFTKTFSTRVVNEQATFFRHLVQKVKSVNEEKSEENGMNCTPSQHNMLTLIDEVEGAMRHKDKNGLPIRPRSISQVGRGRLSNKFCNGNRQKSVSEDTDNSSSFDDSEATEDDEQDLPLSLMELLGVNVVVRSDNVNVMKNIITQVAKEDEGLPETDKTPEEVTLPLRDALNLVILISTIEDQMNKRDSIDENAQSPSGSQWSVITKDNPRDSLPLLTDKFFKGRPRLNQLRE